MSYEVEDRTAAELCDDQFPIISLMGKGLQGDSAILECSDSETETYIKGYEKDEITGTLKKIFETLNINGGQITKPFIEEHANATVPWFTFGMSLVRPGRTEWSWKCPLKIPYIYDGSGGTLTAGDGILINDAHVISVDYCSNADVDELFTTSTNSLTTRERYVGVSNDTYVAGDGILISADNEISINNAANSDVDEIFA